MIDMSALNTSSRLRGVGRKNVPLLVRAFAASGRSNDAPLILVGASSKRQRLPIETAITETGVAGRVISLGYQDEDLIPALYRNCLGHVFRSAYEGFGLPVLEAMACGTPTITNNRSSFPEFAGYRALIADLDIEAFAGAIRQLVDDAQLRLSLTTRGIAQAARFTWQRCALDTLSCCRRALDEG